jgi:SAM-dependent methyltransferase
MNNVEMVKGQDRSRCSICETGLLEAVFYATDRNLSTTGEKFLVARCSACGVAQTLPQPSEAALSGYYPRSYYPEPDLARQYYERVVYELHREKLVRLRQFIAGGRLLDVGCGIGYFVRAAQDAGYEAEGLEWDEDTAAHGRELWKLPIWSGTLSSLDAHESAFDVVTFWQAFEHMQRPREVLERVSALLNPGGVLVIAVPNFSSLQSALFRSRWYHLDLPRHMFHYDPENLSAVVSRHGFRVDRIHFHSREHDWAGILGSVMHLAPVNESVIHKIIRKTVGYHFSLALASIEASIRRGGTFELYARRVGSPQRLTQALSHHAQREKQRMHEDASESSTGQVL